MRTANQLSFTTYGASLKLKPKGGLNGFSVSAGGSLNGL